VLIVGAVAALGPRSEGGFEEETCAAACGGHQFMSGLV